VITAYDMDLDYGLSIYSITGPLNQQYCSKIQTWETTVNVEI